MSAAVSVHCPDIRFLIVLEFEEDTIRPQRDAVAGNHDVTIMQRGKRIIIWKLLQDAGAGRTFLDQMTRSVHALLNILGSQRVLP